jgi:hypothetical protein
VERNYKPKGQGNKDNIREEEQLMMTVSQYTGTSHIYKYVSPEICNWTFMPMTMVL